LEFSLNDVFWAALVLAMLPLVSRIIRQKTTIFRKIFLPSSIIAGVTAAAMIFWIAFGLIAFGRQDGAVSVHAPPEAG
jgi:Na+/glutamate symporter